MRAMTRTFLGLANSRRWLVLVLISAFAGAIHAASLGTRSVGPGWDAGPQAGRLPNVLIVLADDLGYGDVRAFNASGKVATPHLDRLAREGVRFVDAHSNSAVCSPTRYGLMTGRYAWRSRLTSGVLWGESTPLIEPGRPTIASLLRARGYHTAAIGKWHLGLGWAARPGATPSTTTQNEVEWIDYTRPVTGGPLSAGFDSFFGIPASLDMPPYVYVVNDRVERPPTARLPGVPSNDPGFYRGGIAAPGFRVEAVLGQLTAKAVAHVRERAKERERPFFLYLALSAPHTPVAPTPAFAGRSGIGRYGDFVAETDAAIGEVVQALDDAGLGRDTLVIVASDNGAAAAGGIAEARRHGHDASGGFRGAKADLYEGGHRVPFIVRWPGVAPAGTISRRLIATTDVFATLAEITDAPLPDGAGEDSFSFAGALRDPERAAPREAGLVMHSVSGAFAIRQDRFKLLLAPGSGGWSDPKPGSPEEKGLPPTQLYDLEADPKESTNLAGSQPDTAARLERRLASYRDAGRSASSPHPARPSAAAGKAAGAPRRPNVLVAIADDWSFPHAGVYGDTTVRTPNFDRIAREGVRFTHAFVAAPSCTPSRAALLTGQAVHRLEEGANLHGFLPKSYPVYPDLLEDAGYVVGYTGKGWGPGRFEPGGRDRNPAGPVFTGFDEFMQKREPGRPFCFWFGSQDPHRPYEPGTGAQAGMRPEGVRVPRFLPDTAEVRQDLLDYYFEVQRFDRESRAPPRDARTRRRTRPHHCCRDVRQRYAVPPGESQRLRRRRARSIGHPMAGCRGRGQAGRRIGESRRPCADSAGRCWAGAARGDDRTQSPAAASWPAATRARSRLRRTGAPRERQARRPELPGQSNPDERLSVHPELPARSLAGRRPGALRCRRAVWRHRRGSDKVRAARSAGRSRDCAALPLGDGEASGRRAL